MKNFDSRTYSINDFVEWETNEQLVLSPRFQRGQVWSDKARSFLMDTIVRGKPIPKVFIRQSINPQTKKSVREVVDGHRGCALSFRTLRMGSKSLSATTISMGDFTIVSSQKLMVISSLQSSTMRSLSTCSSTCLMPKSWTYSGGSTHMPSCLMPREDQR